MIRKIVIIGPESTGKSTLCAQLASHYHTLWCPEYAREYLLEHGTDYSFDDLAVIARGQLRLEDEFIESVRKSEGRKAGRPLSEARDQKSAVEYFGSSGLGLQSLGCRTSRLLFLDTDMYVMKVWCEFVFGKCHRFILDEIVTRKYDLYLLCNTDLPWVKDELREYPDWEVRETLFHIYKDILINQNTPWAEIKGNNETRFQIAIEAVERLLSTER
ncbi:AAA family ATPase [Niabella aquatica]